MNEEIKTMEEVIEVNEELYTYETSENEPHEIEELTEEI